jgi:transposase
MTKSTRGRYTLEFKQEAVRLVESGQTVSAAARSLGVVEHAMGNWVQARRAGKLKGAGNKPQVAAEQMENSRLRAELARVAMERDILHPTDEDLSAETPAWEKRRRSSRRAGDEVRLYSTQQAGLAPLRAMPCVIGKCLRLSPTCGAAQADR